MDVAIIIIIIIIIIIFNVNWMGFLRSSIKIRNNSPQATKKTLRFSSFRMQKKKKLFKN